MDWQYMFTNFEGRIGRKTWWIGVLVLFAINIIMQMLIRSSGIVQFVVGILILIAGLALHVKRCHDRGKSGWWCLLLLIPIVGLIWAIVDLGILEGDQGDNQYGSPVPA